MVDKEQSSEAVESQADQHCLVGVAALNMAAGKAMTK